MPNIKPIGISSITGKKEYVSDSSDLIGSIDIISGTAKFNSVKTVKVTLDREFDVKPIINLTLSDNNQAPPYKIVINKSEFEIKFKNTWTGEVDWNIIKR